MGISGNPWRRLFLCKNEFAKGFARGTGLDAGQEGEIYGLESDSCSASWRSWTGSAVSVASVFFKGLHRFSARARKGCARSGRSGRQNSKSVCPRGRESKGGPKVGDLGESRHNCDAQSLTQRLALASSN